MRSGRNIQRELLMLQRKIKAPRRLWCGGAATPAQIWVIGSVSSLTLRLLEIRPSFNRLAVHSNRNVACHHVRLFTKGRRERVEEVEVSWFQTVNSYTQRVHLYHEEKPLSGFLPAKGHDQPAQNLTGQPITSQLHSDIQSDSLSNSTGSNHFTEKTTIVPEEWKPTQADQSHTYTHRHTHTHSLLVIKFSRIPRSSTWTDSLLWAVQGCQDHHNDIKTGFD